MLTAQKRKSKTITSVERAGDSLYLRSDYGAVRISPKNGNIVRISAAPKNELPNGMGIGIVYDDAYSDWEYTETEETILINAPSVTLEISKATASIRYFDNGGRLLLAEREKNSREMEEFDSYRTVVDETTAVEDVKTADGVKKRITKTNKVFDKKLFRTRLHLEWQDDEALFGLGQAEEGLLNLRGSTQYLHQANMKIAVPMLLSSKGYGLLLATGGAAIFNDTAYGSYLYTEADAQMDYYFIAGASGSAGAACFDEIIKGYRLLSGKAAMLPRWAFGYIQCQERYETAVEIIETVKEYRKRGVGIDCIVLDWMSWPDGMWGQKSFDRSRFPDPARMMDELHAMNARLMISIWPNMDEKSENHKEFRAQNLLFPANTIYNAFDEKARALYWKQVNEGLFSYGVDAWWCDSSEPFTPEWSAYEKPEASVLYSQYVAESGNFMPLEKLNAFGLAHAQGIYEGQRSAAANNGEKRVVNLTRSGYTGQQRYGTILWSGDTCASWETLRRQIAAGLNFCASGLPYWTLDIGAFFVKPGTPWYWNGEFDAGADDMGYRELYTRWFQYGAFLPVFRAHGTDVRREIWAFGKPGEMFYDALVKAIELRYSLMPYIYSSAAAVWHDDSTIMRMLAFDFPGDKAAIDVKDQYMFGRSIMVCPVTNPMYFEANSSPVVNAEKKRRVYLPGGARWHDFWTGAFHEGGQHITAYADIGKIPLFVKEGSIIPMRPADLPPQQYADENSGAPVELRVYPGCDGEFMYYDDSGDGYGYENGEYSLTRIIWNDKLKEISYEAAHKWEGAPQPEFRVSIVNY